MMRNLARCSTAVLLGLGASLASALQPIDLDAPGALAKLRAEHPADFEVVMAVLADAQRLPEEQVAGFLRTHYEVRSVRLGSFLLTSHPPKRSLSFELEHVPYSATVVVRLPALRAAPAN